MRILVTSLIYAPDDFRINEITARLAREGHEVTVLTGLPDYTTSRIPREYRFFRRRRERINGCDVIRIPMTARRHGVFFRALNYATFALFGALYARCIRLPQVDAIFAYETSPVFQVSPAVVLRRRLGVPLVLYCLDIWPESLKAWNVPESSPVFRVVRRISRRLYRAADTVAVSSQPFIAYLEQLGVDPARLCYLPQDCADIGAQPTPAPHGTFDFYYCGNVGAVQNVDCLLRALAQVPEPEARACIVGDGIELENCRALAQQLQLGDRAVFCGRVPADRMEEIYRQADALVLTLRGGDMIGQTLPAKLQTYMCVGRPIVAAADGATADEIAAADCGLCVPAGDAEALAQAMRTVLRERETFIEKGRNGRNYYEEHFTTERFDRQLIGLLKGSKRA